MGVRMGLWHRGTDHGHVEARHLLDCGEYRSYEGSMVHVGISEEELIGREGGITP